MKLFSVSTSIDALQSNGGSNWISKSGIYEVTIKFASVDVSKNGAQSVNLNIDYNGNDQTIYGPYITNIKGEPIKIGMQLINSLAVIAGLGEGEDLTIEQDTFTVGKDKTPKEFNIIPQFTDLPVKIRLQEEYSINANTKEIRKSMVIKAFYRAVDNASATEIVNNSEAGVQIEKDKAYAENITYLNDLTAEAVQAWKDSKASGAAAPKAAPAASIKPIGSVFKK